MVGTRTPRAGERPCQRITPRTREGSRGAGRHAFHRVPANARYNAQRLGRAKVHGALVGTRTPRAGERPIQCIMLNTRNGSRGAFSKVGIGFRRNRDIINVSATLAAARLRSSGHEHKSRSLQTSPFGGIFENARPNFHQFGSRTGIRQNLLPEQPFCRASPTKTAKNAGKTGIPGAFNFSARSFLWAAHLLSSSTEGQ